MSKVKKAKKKDDESKAKGGMRSEPPDEGTDDTLSDEGKPNGRDTEDDGAFPVYGACLSLMC